jgi:ankyrin repeat protein|eukprot:scaffold367_cov202-Alexandrium_tamarense.AAC.34
MTAFIGHVDVCRYFLDKAADKKKSLANAVTASGNTPLMWACWSGSLDVVKLLTSEGGADPYFRNVRGFNAAHWAASGGSIEICKFLRSELGLDFIGKEAENSEGESPLDVAISFGRANVMEWIVEQMSELKTGEKGDEMK